MNEESFEKRYKIVKVMSEGAFSRKYKCFDRQRGCLCHVRVYDTNDDSEKEMVGDLEKYFMRSSKHHVDSPCIVRLLDSFEFGNRTDSKVLSFEWCDHSDVVSFIKEVEKNSKKLEEKFIGGIMKDCLEGLKKLHEKKMFLRDMRARKILLDSSGIVKINCNGGIREREEGVVGTPYWMPPEVIQGGNYNCKVDIWSLGICLIEMVSSDHKPPGSDVHPMRRIFLIPVQPPPTFDENVECSDEMKDFLSKCLVKDPYNRSSANELLKHPWILKSRSIKYFLKIWTIFRKPPNLNKLVDLKIITVLKRNQK